MFANNPIIQLNIGGAEVFVAEFDEAVEVKSVLPSIRQRAITECADLQTKRQRYWVWQLLDCALKQILGKGVDELTFELDANGKWSCNGGVCFSLSHSDNVVAVAVAEHAVGIDVEALNQARFNQRLAERILTDAERQKYNDLPLDERAQALAKFWTSKESLFKRDGGKSFAPSSFDTTTATTFSENVTFGNTVYVLSLAIQN